MTDAHTTRDSSIRRQFGEEDLRLYLGRDPEPYVAFWERIAASGQPFVWSWTLWGALFPVPWLFYRKLWAFGATLVLLPVLLDALTDIGLQASLAAGLLVGLVGKALVVERAERKTREINALGLVTQDAIARLRRAGGVSVPGAALGTLLMLAGLGLAIYEGLPTRLPTCDSERIRNVVLDIAGDNAEAIGLPGGPLTLRSVRQVGVGEDGHGRLCHGELADAESAAPIAYDVLWQSPGSRRYVVDLRRRRPAAE